MTMIFDQIAKFRWFKTNNYNRKRLQAYLVRFCPRLQAYLALMVSLWKYVVPIIKIIATICSSSLYAMKKLSATLPLSSTFIQIGRIILPRFVFYFKVWTSLTYQSDTFQSKTFLQLFQLFIYYLSFQKWR